MNIVFPATFVSGGLLSNKGRWPKAKGLRCVCDTKCGIWHTWEFLRCQTSEKEIIGTFELFVKVQLNISHPQPLPHELENLIRLSLSLSLVQFFTYFGNWPSDCSLWCKTFHSLISAAWRRRRRGRGNQVKEDWGVGVERREGGREEEEEQL